MCTCNLIVEQSTNKPIDIDNSKHSFVYTRHGKSITLLEDFNIPGVINYSALHEIKDQFGVKSGYIFVIGEKE